MFVGIEIGGTKLQLGLGRGDGQILAMWRGQVDPRAGGEGIRKQIEQAVPELLATARLDRSTLRGVGIGFGGPVDDATATVIKSHQIAGWDGFPLAAWISDLLQVPAVLCNDADVAGLGEALFGAGKGLSPIFYITLGSGVGGGLIIDGKIYRGCGRGAAEIGHLRMRHPTRIEQTRMEILEGLTSGWGIESQVGLEEKLGRDLAGIRKHALPGPITARAVALAASEGDAVAREILDNAWQALAEGICSVIALLCPRRVVIGGGVSLMGEELLFRPLREHVAARVFEPFRNLTEIVPAVLGEEMVVHGALALAARKCDG